MAAVLRVERAEVERVHIDELFFSYIKIKDNAESKVGCWSFISWDRFTASLDEENS